MAAPDLDIGYVAGHLGLDQPVIATLATEPTADLVAAVLRAVANKAHEFETLYAEKLETDIALENAVRNSESRSQTSKATTEKALKDVEEARQKLREEETKRQTVENELRVTKAKIADHDAEVKALNDKIETLQSSNRTNMSIIESNNKRDQTVTEELTKQHQRNVELAREVTSLQQSEQNARGQLNSAKYREESLQQQLDLTRRNGEWLENELKTKSEEALKFRKEKGARIAELQRQNEDAISQVDSFKRTEQQLRDRLTAMQSKIDDSLVKIQKQEESFAATEDSYKHELEDQRRLVELSNQLSRQHQDRVRELEAEKERLRDNSENEIRRVRVELEQERRVVTEMEEKIRQLESELDETQARMEHAAPLASAPQTPRANGGLARAASPFGTPASIRSKSAITATQAIEQLYQVKGQLANEKRRNQQLVDELDNMLAALEAKAPEIQELQAESENLRAEIAHMSELSQQSFQERDLAKKSARKAENMLSTAQSESKILRTQLRDLGTQIQMLVFNAYALEKGIEQLTDEEVYRLKQLEKGEVTEEALNDMSDTHQFITQKLVVFKDVASLQAKNEDLLRITRELAEQMESEEALAAKHQAKEDHDKVETLEQELLHLTEESRSIKNTMESYKTERDMFRRLLQQRTAGGDEASMMRSSLDGRAPLANLDSIEQTETLSEALRKLQSEYDSFREAQDGVRKDLRHQLDSLSAEKSTLQSEKIKLHGEARLESERREMLQGNYTALQNENRELQKRNQVLSETAAKQDIRTQQVAEELIDTKGLLDSTRNETANLKAEKKLWKDREDRLCKENETLGQENGRLSTMLATQQSVDNERILSESEARRKAQARVEHLEQEFNDVQRRLSQSAEESKHLQQRKEFESRESQKRIDELMSSLGQVREDLVAAKTTKDHLQARVDELTVELKNAEERVGRLQPRPTPRPGAETSQYQQDLETQVQELNTEISDIKRDLDLANTQLENAKAQAEQYKELSQANEETLEDLRSVQEQYKEEMTSLIEEKDNKVKEFSQRLEDMSSELSRTNTELSTLRDSQGDIARKYEDEKTILEDEVKRLKDDSARHAESARFHQQDLRAQAEIASKAQQDYEQELVKHADAAKLVQQLRKEHNELKSAAAAWRAEAESAKVTLAQNESSWDDRKSQLEQEMTELKARREDVNAQNKLLHQQLEGLSSQVAALQQSRQSADGAEETTASIGTGDVSEGLRELNNYLRREKEILEVQYDLKSQEAKRLQQQVEYVQSQLDETKLKLDQERTQSVQSNRSSVTHQELMEKLNELNLYRESSMALRSENGQLKDQIAAKAGKIQELETKVQPLEAEIDNLNTQKSFLEDEIKQIQEDRDRWQKRTEGILTKYGRVDPAEMEQLKTTITELETKCQTLKEGEEPLKVKVTELEATLEAERNNWQTTRTRLTEQFKERSRKLSAEKNEAAQRANQLQEQLDKANADLEGAQSSTDQAGSENETLQQQVEELKQQLEQLQQNPAPAAPAAAPATAPISEDAGASAAVVQQLEQQLTEIRAELESINTQKADAEQQLESLRGELQTAVAERDEALNSLSANGAAGESAAPAPSTTETTDSVSAAAAGLTDEERQALQEQISAAEAKATKAEALAAETEANIQQTVKDRCNKMKDTLNNKLKESRAKMEEEYKKKEDDLNLKLEQEKLIWQAENAATAAPAANAEATPAAPTPAPAPAVSGAAALQQLDDTELRQFLATNATAKGIISSNIKKRLDAESAKVKGEYEAKITAAREQAQMMEAKKSSLRINMNENKLRAANTKIGVVETAAKETPERPVGEVWEAAKAAPVPPAPAPAAPATPKVATPARQASMSGPTTTPSKPADAAPATPTAAAPAAAAQPNNPFAVPANAAAPAAANPFANAAPAAAAAQPAAAPVRSGIPMPRGGGRGRGGTYVPPGQRAASGNHEGATAGAVRGGRGGARGGRGGMNPVAADFQPGSKRPRGDSEAGAGAKRPRGAH
ncbi:Putative Filament-forming protein [[Torrubiella] hemipterigena]|uniref:Putative Filament-forming protein n=1 Tax=[Torrubiella] hemipterigena TaxID=1531966 RepID=A0A0A1T1Y2_9HYPO|nr:Putative Filament-forming protein [[Torrubiella] hemipterigena]